MSDQTTARFPRRTLIAGASSGLAGAALLRSPGLAQAPAASRAADCGCASGPGLARAYAAQSSANIPTPRETTLIVEAHETSVFDSFNPYIPNGEAWFYGSNQVGREAMFYANFLTGEIVPWLAESWAYNADFTELTLMLNPNAAWSDGNPFTSDDVVFSLEMVGGNEALTGNSTVTENIASIAAPDAATVVMTLTGPRPRFHYNFIVGIVFDGLRVVPRHIWESQDPATFKNNPPVYTGPYVLDQIIPEQFMYVWRKNPAYWNAANLDPQPEHIVFRQFLPTDAATLEFERGNIDVANADAIGYLNQQAIMGSYDKISTFEFADPCPRAFYLNFDSPSGLFATPEGRWAISYLVDRDLIGTTIWQPPSRPAQFPWADYAGNERWSNPEIEARYDLVYDPARAEEMLAAAGAVKTDGAWTMNGEPIQLTVIIPGGTTVQEYQIAQTLADNAAAIGLDIVLSALTFPAWTDALNLGQYDISCHWVCGLAFDPNELYDNFLSADTAPIGEVATNVSRTQIPELDEIVATLDTLSPEDENNQAEFDAALEIFMRNLPVVPSIQTIFPVTFGTAVWEGWPTDDDPSNIPMYWWAQFLFVIGNLRPAGA